MALSQATVNVGASDGLTDRQLARLGATDKQIADIPATVRPAPPPTAHVPEGHAAQAHANVHVTGGVSNNPPTPPQVIMAQQVQHPVAQFMGVALPVHTGSAAFRLTTMAPWLYALIGAVATMVLLAAITGWMRPTGASVTTPPAVTAPVAAAAPQVIKIDPIKITVDVTGVQPGKP